MQKAILIRSEHTELEGPYECPDCHGHLMVDSTYVDQVSDAITCPYCRNPILVPVQEDQGGNTHEDR